MVPTVGRDWGATPRHTVRSPGQTASPLRLADVSRTVSWFSRPKGMDLLKKKVFFLQDTQSEFSSFGFKRLKTYHAFCRD